MKNSSIKITVLALALTISSSAYATSSGGKNVPPQAAAADWYSYLLEVFK